MKARKKTQKKRWISIILVCVLLFSCVGVIPVQVREVLAANSENLTQAQLVANSEDLTQEQLTTNSEDLTQEQPTPNPEDLTQEQPIPNPEDLTQEQPTQNPEEPAQEQPTQNPEESTQEQPTQNPEDPTQVQPTPNPDGTTEVIPEPTDTTEPVSESAIDEVTPEWLEQNSESTYDSTGVIRVHFLNVDHGNATLVECDGQYLLIDGGHLYKYDQEKESVSDKWMGEIAYDYLESRGIDRLDYVIASHPDADHIAGLVPILQDFDIGQVYMPKIPWKYHKTTYYYNMLMSIKQNNIPVVYPDPGDTFMVGGAKVTVLSPKRLNYADFNNTTIVVRIVYGKRSFLIAGDTLKEAEAEMIASGMTLKSDVLQVPHHSIAGVTAQTTDQIPFLEAVRPKYSIISNNIMASWTILNQLRKTSDVYATYKNGHIIAWSDGKDLTFTCEKWSQPTYYASDVLKVENASSKMKFVGEGGDGTVGVYYKEPTKFKFSGRYGYKLYTKVEYMAVKEGEEYHPEGTWKEGDTVLVENGFRGRIFVRFSDESGHTAVTKTRGFAVDEIGIKQCAISSNKNTRIRAIKVSKVNQRPLVCRGKTTLTFSAIFGPSGKYAIYYQKAKKGKKVDLEKGWTKGESVTLKKGFNGQVYVGYVDNCGRIEYRKSQWFKVLKKKK